MLLELIMHEAILGYSLLLAMENNHSYLASLLQMSADLFLHNFKHYLLGVLSRERGGGGVLHK